MGQIQIQIQIQACLLSLSSALQALLFHGQGANATPATLDTIAGIPFMHQHEHEQVWGGRGGIPFILHASA